MHHGFQIVQEKPVKETEEISLVAEYKEHESLAYGLDFRSIKSTSKLQLASCSFYDHLLKIWDVNINRTGEPAAP